MLTIDARQVSLQLQRQVRLQQIDLQLPAAQMLALLGHNGAGKSTLIKLLLGLYRPDSGCLQVLGQAAGTQPHAVGYLPENVSFYPHMSVQETLQFYARLKGINGGRVSQLLQQFALSDCARRAVGVCSKGERQRLGLAQALLSDVKLLLLDEPTVGLDPQSCAFMYQQLQQLRAAGCSIVICTHELALVAPVADRLLLLAHGQIAASGTLSELQQQAALPWQILLPLGQPWQQDPHLAPWLTQQQLRVPAALLPAITARLVNHWHCLDYQIQPPDLWQLYQYYLPLSPPSSLAVEVS